MKNKIISFCKTLNIDTIGFVKCRKFVELRDLYEYRKEEGLENEFEENIIEKRINPYIYMREAKTIISIALPYNKDYDNNEEMYFSKYTKGLDYHKVVKSYLDKICDFIKSFGEEAISLVDNNMLPERYIAALSGIGFIGKNNMLITEKYGSYVFLGEIITSIDVECFDNTILNDVLKFERCGKCNKCYNECPTKSIKCDSKDNNTNICLSYITQKKHIEDKWFNILDGRLFGCDTCQDICPYNENIEISKVEEFDIMNFMNKINIEEILYMDKKIFKEKYIKTSCGWRGKSILQRNALIACIMAQGSSFVEEHKILSPYVKEYYNRLLNK